jgi:predicted SnoaL-like aldol condensation-catalyzing enzyme
MNSSLKDTATKFLLLCASGHAHEAFPKYTSPQFRHHNPWFAADAESLMTAMDDNAAQHPDKTLEILHTLQDGDMVATHSRVRMKPGQAEMAVVHLFRFEGDRIAELWDIGQQAPDNSPNRHGMF